MARARRHAGDVRDATDERGIPGPYGSDPNGTFLRRRLGSPAASTTHWPVSVRHACRLGGDALPPPRPRTADIDSEFAEPVWRAFERHATGRPGASQADVRIASELERRRRGRGARRARAAARTSPASRRRAVPVERDLVGFFGEARFEPTRAALLVTAGIRVERIHRDALEGDPNAFSPRPPSPTDTIVSANPSVAGSWFVSPDATATYWTQPPRQRRHRHPPARRLRDRVHRQPVAAARAQPQLRRRRRAGIPGRARLIADATSFCEQLRRPDRHRRRIVRRTPADTAPTTSPTPARAGSRSSLMARRSAACASRAAYTLSRHRDPGGGRLGFGAAALHAGRPAAPPAAASGGADVTVVQPRWNAFARLRARGRALDVDPSFGVIGGLLFTSGLHRRRRRRRADPVARARRVRARHQPVRSQLRGSARLPAARTARDRGSQGCCRAADVSFALPARAAGPATTCRSRCRAARLSASSGPNGSGKTTLLRLLSGHSRPAQGEVRSTAVRLASIPRTALARRIAVVAAGHASRLRLHGARGRADGPLSRIWARSSSRDRPTSRIARAALAATGTRAFVDRPFDTLSGGEKQRVVIAAALAQFERRRRASCRQLGGCAGAAARRADGVARPALSARDRRAPAAPATANAASRSSSRRTTSTSPRRCATQIVLLRKGRVARAGTDGGGRSRRTTSARSTTSTPTFGCTIAAGHLTVVPARPGDGSEAGVLRRRVWLTSAGFGALAIVALLLAPLVGSTPISFGRVFDRSIPFADNVDAQIFFIARLPRTLAAALVGAAARRGRRRVPGAAAQSAGDAVHARRVGGRRARRDARDHVRLCRWHPGHPGGAARELRRRPRRRRHRLRPGERTPPRLSTDVLLLAGVTLNAFFSALILFVQYFADFAADVPDGALADGRSRRQQLRADRRGAAAAARAFVAFAWLPRPLNLLSLGADAAGARGVDVVRAQRLAFFSASLATGAAVSVGGPDRLHRHHRAAPRAADRRRRPSPGAAGVGAVRRGVSGRVRCRRADGRWRRSSCRSASSRRSSAGRSFCGCWFDRKRRDDDRGRLISGLRPSKSHERILRAVAPSGLPWRSRSARARRAQPRLRPRPRGSSRSSRRSPRCCSRSAPGPQVVGVSSFDEYPPEVGSCAARRRAARSRPRAHPRRSGPTWSSSTTARPTCTRQLERAPDPDVRLPARRSRRRHRDDPPARRHGSARDAGSRRAGRATSSSGIDRVRTDASPAGRGRARCSSSAGSPGALRNIYASGGIGFLHDMLIAAGGDERVRRRQAQQSVQATTRADPRAAPGGDPRASQRRHVRASRREARSASLERPAVGAGGARRPRRRS